MDDRAGEHGRQVQVREVQPGTAPFEQVLILAARVLAQDRYLVSRLPQALESHVLAAFDGTRRTGFLRYLVQVTGAEEGRPAVIRDGGPLLEGYAGAFGVDPQRRRRGIGTALQQHAARRCRAAGCMRLAGIVPGHGGRCGRGGGRVRKQGRKPPVSWGVRGRAYFARAQDILARQSRTERPVLSHRPVAAPGAPCTGPVLVAGLPCCQQALAARFLPAPANDAGLTGARRRAA